MTGDEPMRGGGIENGMGAGRGTSDPADVWSLVATTATATGWRTHRLSQRAKFLSHG